MFLSVLLDASAGAAAGGTGNFSVIMVIYILFIVGLFWFMGRGRKKEEKQAREMQDSVKAGDSITTTSGFYGVVLDVVDDTVIVEFGNNKNCRIPMMKTAIAAVERAEDGVEE
ncbi:MAG: preprotein translocase subunit YajC [Lachnospiraceae bacterium]|nr:preprotein translocase subunit YajC [Lachnospiraceae bacterium]